MSDTFKRRRRHYVKTTNYPYDGRCNRCHRRVRMNHGIDVSPCFTCGGTVRRDHANRQRKNA